MFLSVVGSALSADCLAIRKQIDAQTDILQRKELAKQGIIDCPNDPIINFEYAYAMERLRKYKVALKHYQVAAKLAPKYAKSYFGMGDMYINLERPKDAVKAYQTGLSLEPENKRAQNSLAEAMKLAKQQSGGDDDIAAFVNPLDTGKKEQKAEPKTAKKTAAQETNPLPYEPTQALILQDPEIMEPLIINPMEAEALQVMQFDKAGHSDITGSLDDNQMGAD
jgi:tetratricopeptide (TPR) repeat protein